MQKTCDRPEGQGGREITFERILPKGPLADALLSRDQQREAVLQENEQIRQIIRNLIGSMQTQWMSLNAAIDRLNEAEKNLLLDHVGLVSIQGTFFLSCREDAQRLAVIDSLTQLLAFMDTNKHATLLGSLLSLDMPQQDILRQYISYSY